MLGAMAMPAAFKYRDVFLKGKPQHILWDDFTVKHPPMSPAHWAKIFSPFDALKGFDEEISSKEEIFEGRHELDEDERRKLDRKLSILHGYTFNSQMARENKIKVNVVYFVPSQPLTQENYEEDGRYEDVTGMVLNVDEVTETLSLRTEVGDLRIEFGDILEIRPEKESLFEDVLIWEEA